MDTQWTHPLVRAASTPVTGADVPPAPRPAFETVQKNSECASAGDLQQAPCVVPYGPFLPPEPRDSILVDPARMPMGIDEIVRWNQLVSRGSDDPVVYSGVPLVRYADLAQGRSGGDMNQTTHRGNQFAVLGRLDADGRPVVETDRNWMGQQAPEDKHAMKVVTASPFYPLPDKEIRDVAWSYPREKQFMRDGQPFYRLSWNSWEGFDGEMGRTLPGAKEMGCDWTGRTGVMVAVVLVSMFMLWKMGGVKKNLLGK